MNNEVKGMVGMAMEQYRINAREFFSMNGGVVPAAFVFGRRRPEGAELLQEGDGPIEQALREGRMMTIVPAPEGEDYGPKMKDRHRAMIRYVAQDSGAYAIGFICEAWMTITDKKWIAERWARGGISDEPDRVEVIICSVEYEDGDAEFWTSEIIRDAVQAAASDWVRRPEEVVSLGGRLANFLGWQKEGAEEKWTWR